MTGGSGGAGCRSSRAGPQVTGSRSVRGSSRLGVEIPTGRWRGDVWRALRVAGEHPGTRKRSRATRCALRARRDIWVRAAPARAEWRHCDRLAPPPIPIVVEIRGPPPLVGAPMPLAATSRARAVLRLRTRGCWGGCASTGSRWSRSRAGFAARRAGSRIGSACSPRSPRPRKTACARAPCRRTARCGTWCRLHAQTGRSASGCSRSSATPASPIASSPRCTRCERVGAPKTTAVR